VQRAVGRILGRLVVLVVVGAWPAPAGAQDAHYWSQQYGTRAELLGGAVVGSILDLSSTYYNPGALALMKDPSVLLSAKAFEYRKLYVLNADGDRVGFEDDRFGPTPTLFTTLIPFTRDRLAFSAFTRETFKVNASARVEQPLETAPGTVASEYHVDYDLSDTWFGITWARPIGPGLGFGVTPYLAVRSQRNRQEALIQVESDSSAALGVLIDDYHYTHYRLLMKAGVTWLTEPWSVGLTVTTPSLGLGFLSGGEAFFDRSFVGADLDGDGTPDDFLAFSPTIDAESEFHSPLSIAIGFAYRFPTTVLHVSGEWFDAVDAFSALDIDDLPSQFPGLSLTRRLLYEAQSVRNVGIGIEQTLPRGVEIYGSFTTDFSAATDRQSANHTLAAWDLYHFTGGAALKILGLDLTGGLEYAFGESPIGKAAVFEGGSLVPGDPPELTMRYRRLKFILGFAFTL